ncbi:conserved hypothetical protein [Flavobacterium sp. 9R]|nr:conserved hypothetical protein [Flavobacterium sp. 9R]
MTKLQKITIIALLLYAVWETYVQFWSKTEETPIIRVDLFILYPILLFLIIATIIQYIKNKK